MKFAFRLIVSVLSVFGGVVAASAAEQPTPRYLASMENGERIADEQIRNWYSNNALPQLAGRNLISGDQSMRWLLDRALQPSEKPNAYIELISGDRLPGEVVRFVPTGVQEGGLVPAHFVVVPSVDIRAPDDERSAGTVRVLERFVKKIAWRRAAPVDHEEPSTVYYRDGRKLRFRAVRLLDGDVHLLLDSGRRVATFDELAELHLPETNRWHIYFDELAMLFPDGFRNPREDRLLQWETIDGLVATTSLQRFDVDSQGDNNQGDRWVHALQPAWSLDAFWIPNARSYLRRCFAPDQPPLIRFATKEDRSGAFFSKNGWPARTNRSVVGGPLRTGDALFGWGIGVLAASEITVPLSPLVRGFRTQVGLDYAAREGGCVQARIFLDDERLFESPLIVGSKEIVDSGPLSWPAGQPSRRLRLAVDPAHANRPEGADPFDIRDLTNWLEPQLTLDRKALEQEVRERAVRQISAWQGWAAAPQPGGKIRIVNLKHDVDGAPIEWRLAALAIGKPFELRRTLELGETDRWLSITTDHWGSFGDPPRIEVLLEGATALDEELPESRRHEAGQTPQYVSLAGRRGAIEAVIRQYPCDQRTPIDWRQIAVGRDRTTLVALLEDPTEAEVAQMRTVAGDLPGVERVDAASLIGAPAIRISAGDFVETTKLDPPAPIAEHAALGELRYLKFAYRKSGGGQIEIALLHDGDQEKPFVYRLGEGAKKEPGCVVLNQHELKDEWKIYTVDPYADFGELKLTGIALRVVDGGPCLFDHFYLARRHSDFERIDAPNPDRNNWERWDERRERNLPQALAAAVSIDYGDGRRGRGFLFDAREGWIVAPGHQSFPPQRDVRVATADGRTWGAKTLGVDREHDLGLLQIVDPPPEEGWPAIELTQREKYDRQQVLLAVGVDDAQAPAAEVIRKKGEFSEAIWTTAPSFPYEVGQGAIEHELRLGGMCVALLSDGWPVMVNPVAVRTAMERLKRNEVLGDWLIGAGPRLAMTVSQAEGGVEVTEVAAGGPADEIGFRVGDLLTKVNGRDVRSRGDVLAAVAELNPGDQVEVEYRRVAVRSTKRLQLGRRP